MKIAIVILNYNGVHLLEELLPKIMSFSNDAHIVLADNCSTDGSIAFVSTHFPSVEIIKNSKNFGFAKGYNEALKHVKADVYCILNSDVEVTEHWLKPIKNLFKNEKIGIVQPKILDYYRRSHFEYAGAAGGLIDFLGYPFCKGRIFFNIEEDKGQYDKDQEVFWASGACLFIRAQLFHVLGGFDEDYFAHQEEIDLCWRSQHTGNKVWYCAASKVYHMGGATLDKYHPMKTFFNFRNSLFSILKNAPTSFVFLVLFARLILDIFAILYFLGKGQLSHSIAVFKAHFSFYAFIPKMMRKRKSICNKLNTYYFTKKSIVLNYFIFKKIKYIDYK